MNTTFPIPLKVFTIRPEFFSTHFPIHHNHLRFCQVHDVVKFIPTVDIIGDLAFHTNIFLSHCETM